MSKLPDDKLLLLTNIPGSHDSTAYNMNIFGSVFAKCQDLNIMDQLKIGVRLFDIRITKQNDCALSCGINQIISNLDYDLICCHGICDCYYINDVGAKKNLTFKDVLIDMKNFLEENPSETIILGYSSGRGDSYNNIKRAIELVDKIVGDISIKFNRNLTIGEARGKIINTNYKSDQINSDGKIIFQNGYGGGTGLDEIHQKFVPDFTYSTFKVTGELKVEEVKVFLETYDITMEKAEEEWKTNDKKFPFRYSISCTGEFESIAPFPKTQADFANNFFLNYDLKKGNYYGWISIDFLNIDITKKLIDTNFKLNKR